MDKISLIDIQTALRMKFALSDKASGDILAKFFALIKKALQEEKYVKVKGLGIFKLIEVEPRKSVSVNTGKEIEIQSYRKIIFTPDAQLKELVNKPFAHFEVVELKDDDALPMGCSTAEIPSESSVEPADNEQMSVSVGEEAANVEEVGVNNGKTDIEPETFVEEEFSVSKREDLLELERMLELEHNKNRFFLGVIVVLVVMLLVGGLLFFLAPELLEQWIYAR